MPKGIDDRPADVWEPLIMIGDYAGGTWRGNARTAAVEFTSGQEVRAPSDAVQLHADIRVVFTNKRVDRISTVDLIKSLTTPEELNRPGMVGGSLPWKRGWSHAYGTDTGAPHDEALHPG